MSSHDKDPEGQSDDYTNESNDEDPQENQMTNITNLHLIYLNQVFKVNKLLKITKATSNDTLLFKKIQHVYSSNCTTYKYIKF